MSLETLLTSRSAVETENSRATAISELEAIFPSQEWGIEIDVNKYTDENIQNLWGNELRAALKRALQEQGRTTADFKNWLGDIQFVNVAIYSKKLFGRYRSNAGWRVSLFSLPRADVVILAISSHYQNAQNHNKLGEASNLLFDVIEASKEDASSPEFLGRPISSADWDRDGLILQPIDTVANTSIAPSVLFLKDIRTTTVKKTLASFITLSVIPTAGLASSLHVRLTEVKHLAESLLTNVYPFNNLEEFESFRSLALQDMATAHSRLQLRGSKSARSAMRIYYGPPGTGKTLSAVRYAVTLADPGFLVSEDSQSAFTRFNELRNQCAFVTFHPSLQYEDIVESIRPAIEVDELADEFAGELGENDAVAAKQDGGGMTDEGRSLRYKLHEGPLLRLARRALVESNKEFVMVVDEINRGDLSRILGPLISSLDTDKRLGSDFPIGVELMYPRAVELESRLFLPSNLHIVGTMNSADRNIALVDHALRRRFEFIEVPPTPSLLGSSAGEMSIDRRRLLSVINTRIEHLLDADHCIGHGYLMRCKTDADVVGSFAKNIIPLLREYFYGNEGLVKLVLSETLENAPKIFVADPASDDFAAAFGVELDSAVDFGYRPGTGARALRIDERLWSTNGLVSGPTDLSYAVSCLKKIYQWPPVEEPIAASTTQQN